MSERSYRENYAPLLRDLLPRLDASCVLKADAWNEAHEQHPISGFVPAAACHLVEIDAAIVARARAAHPDLDVREGDIRRLPFDAESMSLVLDLSTIDHVPDPDRAIKEYHRVLRPAGRLLLVSWVSLFRGTRRAKSAYGGEQYFFDCRALRQRLQRRFDVEAGWLLSPGLVGTTGGHHLVGVDLHAYLCRRRENGEARG
jgi:SAM-dependent methyltransferase